jgi:hypothetical protein
MATAQLEGKVVDIPANYLSLFTKVKKDDKVVFPININEDKWNSFLIIADKFAQLNVDELAKYNDCPNWTNNGIEKQWYSAAILTCSSNSLFEQIGICNTLGFTTLLNILCHAAADHIRDKTPAEVRHWLNVSDDLPTNTLDWWTEDLKDT